MQPSGKNRSTAQEASDTEEASAKSDEVRINLKFRFKLENVPCYCRSRWTCWSFSLCPDHSCHVDFLEDGVIWFILHYSVCIVFSAYLHVCIKDSRMLSVLNLLLDFSILLVSSKTLIRRNLITGGTVKSSTDALQCSVMSYVVSLEDFDCLYIYIF